MQLTDNSQNTYNDTYTIADRGQYINRYLTNYELNNDFLLIITKALVTFHSMCLPEVTCLTQKWYGQNTINGFLLKPNLFTVSNAGWTL